MAEPFPAEPIRTVCPSCGTSILFPRLLGLAPGSTVSCDCPRCGRKVSVVNSGVPHPSRALRAAVLLVALVVIAAAALALVLWWHELPRATPHAAAVGPTGELNHGSAAWGEVPAPPRPVTLMFGGWGSLMANRARVVGIHRVAADEPVHLVELEVEGSAGDFDVGEVTQELTGQPRSNWQAVFDERKVGENRLACFSHYLDAAKPLLGPWVR